LGGNGKPRYSESCDKINLEGKRHKHQILSRQEEIKEMRGVKVYINKPLYMSNPFSKSKIEMVFELYGKFKDLHTFDYIETM